MIKGNDVYSTRLSVTKTCKQNNWLHKAAFVPSERYFYSYSKHTARVSRTRMPTGDPLCLHPKQLRPKQLFPANNELPSMFNFCCHIPGRHSSFWGTRRIFIPFQFRTLKQNGVGKGSPPKAYALRRGSSCRSPRAPRYFLRASMSLNPLSFPWQVLKAIGSAD